MKTYVGISRDHSSSMYSLIRAAVKDYNGTIEAIKNASNKQKQDTIVSVVSFNQTVTREHVNSSVNALTPLLESQYYTSGMTSLFDSVGVLIDEFLNKPDYDDPNVAFLIIAVTDGEDNTSSKYTASVLAKKIKQLQLTDKWTFIFRVPAGYDRKLVNMGIPSGNIQVWEQTNEGLNRASQETAAAFTNYYSERAAGKRSTTSFYKTDLSSVSRSEVRSVMQEITNEVETFKVDSTHDGYQIRDFIQEKTGVPFVKGTAFYELMKTEKAVQDYKIIIIKDKKSAKIYAGSEARTLLGLPTFGTIKLSPGDHGNFKIFVQSTSVNRKLLAGTSVMYWKKVRQI